MTVDPRSCTTGPSSGMLPPTCSTVLPSVLPTPPTTPDTVWVATCATPPTAPTVALRVSATASVVFVTAP
ncbi:MAG TPA: hypothetical protein VH141_30200, partial [Pseudonocardia sp.]|nr:hypothetical protein [Pseudonocardia sp.]